MATIGTLNAKIILNNKQWQTAMTQTILSIHRLRDESKRVSVGLLKKQLDSVSGSLSSFALSARTVGGALAVIGSGIAAFVLGMRQSMAAVDQLTDRATELGVGNGVLQALEGAAIATGAKIEQLAGAFTFMLDKIGDAQRGSEDARKFIEGLGLSVEQLAAIRPEQSFLLIADAINKLDSQAKKVSAIREMFGRGGIAVGPLLGMGSEGIIGAANKAGAGGMVLGEGAIKSVEVLDTAWKRFKVTASNAVTATTSAISNWLSPAVDAVASALNSVVRTGLPASFVGTATPIEAAGAAPKDKPVRGLTAQDTLKDRLAAARGIVTGVVNAGDSPLQSVLSQLSNLNLPHAEMESFSRLIRDIFAGRELIEFRDNLQKIGDTIRASVLTPAEQIKGRVDEAVEALQQGAIDFQTLQLVIRQANTELDEMEKRRLDAMKGPEDRALLGGGLRTAKELGIVEGAQRGPAGGGAGKIQERQVTLLQTIAVTLGRIEKRNMGMAA